MKTLDGILRTQLREIVFEALDGLNEHRSPADRVSQALDTPLAGEGGPLDSLAFVNLVVGLEQRLEQTMGVTFNFFGDERLDPSGGAFRTVQSLIDCLETLIPHMDTRMDGDV